jgi:hypothetical protein
VDDAIETDVLKALEPGAIETALQADRKEATRRDEVPDALNRTLRRAMADRAFRQYDAKIRQPPCRGRGSCSDTRRQLSRFRKPRDILSLKRGQSEIRTYISWAPPILLCFV